LRVETLSASRLQSRSAQSITQAFHYFDSSDRDSVSGLKKTGVGGSIPSLATTNQGKRKK
jgi:hypothetical protein